MKLTNKFIVAAAVVSLSMSGLALASIVAYTNSGAIPGGAGGNLNIGRQFSVTGSGVTVHDLGVYDQSSDGLVNPHTVTLFSISALGNNPPTTTPLGSVLVPSGTGATLASGFRFSSLGTDLYLTPGNYSVVAYGTNVSGGDPYGDGGGTPVGNNLVHFAFDPYQFTGNLSPFYPVGGDSGNHSSASFRFDVGNTIRVPEPSTILMLLLGGLGIFGWVKRNRRVASAI